jgi:uncharacterized delta-60 repeat protein
VFSSRNVCWFRGFALTAILVATATASPPPGSDDPSFDPGRGPTKVNPGRGHGPVIQPDGKILVGGHFNALNLNYVPPILRFNPDGSLDPNFDASILTPAQFDISGFSFMYPLALQPNGQILIGGHFTRPDGSIQYLVRLNANGTLDSAFQPRFGKSEGSPAIRQAVIVAGGKILLAGEFDSINGVPRQDMVRLNADGSLDTTFTPSIASDFAVQSSGKIIVKTVDSMHRLNSDGSSDNSFHPIITTPNGDPPALKSLVVQKDDKILFSYVFNFGGWSVIDRLNADGQNDVTFQRYQTQWESEATVNLVQKDGGIIINSLTSIDPGRLKSNGEPDWDFQRDELLYSVAQQSDGKLVMASTFYWSPPYGIRRVFLDGVLDPSFAPDVGLTVIMQAASGNVALMPNGKIVIAGDFNYVDRTRRETIAVLNHDGTPYQDFDASDLILSEGLYASVSVVAVQANGKILAALLTPAQMRVQKIVRINQDGSLDGSFTYDAPAPNDVRSIVVQPNGKILVDCNSGLMRINPDGTRDATFNAAEPALIVLLQPDGKLLVNNSHGLRRLNPDGSPDAGFSPAGMNAYNPPSASAIQPDGKYLASHRDISAFRNVFVRLNRGGSLDGTFASDVNNVTLVALDQAGIYAAGSIEPFGTEPHLGICRFNSDGSRDPNFNVEFNPDATLSQLLLQPDGQLLITGTFNQVYGVEHRGIARIIGSAPNKVANISTRARIGTGENVGIGGFIVTGSAPKKIIVRAVGPSLQASGLPASETLSDPRIELRDSTGALVAHNNNWRDSQENDIASSGFSMGHDLEAAILVTVPPGHYTAIVAGADGGEGVALVEAYDLDPAVDSALANISTRGVIQTGDNIMIGGFILRGSQSPKVVVRALGPSLTGSGITAVLADPTVELHDQSGAIIASNNDWKETQQAELAELGFALSNDRESALIATLPPGPYTTVVHGNGGQTGVGLLEVYKLP